MESENSTVKNIFNLFSFFNSSEVYNSSTSDPQNISSTRRVGILGENLERVMDGTLNFLNPVMQIFATTLSENESYTYRDMLKQKDYRDFIDAMVIEINDHTERKYGLVRERLDCNNPKTILSVWSFKRKRYPDGSLNERKARLCAHGGTI